ncbi:MAG TPA: hypothetical protein VNQ73_23510 [Ilumatobacter sp.]|nr:hypothetical protein [Ilumatobacter sp.]
MTELPKGWALATVNDLIGSNGLFVDGDWVESKDQDPGGEVRLTQLADVGEGQWRNRSDRYLTAPTADQLGCSYLEVDDVLVARMPDPLGRACLFPGDPRPCVTVVDVAIVRPGPDSVRPRWLMWAINSPAIRAAIEAQQAGTTRKRISRKNLGQVEVQVPPLAEQERIVTAIEEAFSKLDAGEAGLRVVRQLLKRMRDAILSAAVTGRLVPQDPTDTPAAKLLADLGVEAAEPDGVPELPPSWAWTELGVIAEVVGGVTKDSKRQSDASFVEVPYLRVANVQRGFLDLETITTIRVAPEKAAQLELQRGDVLFNEGGDRDKLGRGWVWESQIASCIHQNHVFRARLSGGVEPKLVSIWGNTFGRGWFEDRGKQTTNLASLNLKTLKAFPVPIAPVEEQSRILAEVERQMSFLDACERAVEIGLARSAGLRRSVLKAAFEGRLVPQDPSDEPATVLLERIRAERSVQSVAKRRARQTA